LTHARALAHRPLACRLAVGLALIACLAGCARHKVSPPPDAATHAQQLLEAGNAAYQAGDYRLAARRYGAAAVVRSDDPAAYYGLGMALAKLGRDEDARTAYARARMLAQRQQQ
jgi:Flp pilus assembly protein TadD